MTRDTKIGLLLGLVFIFIIAVLINGLPKVKAKARSETAARSGPEFRSTSPGLGVRESVVRQWAQNEPAYTRSLETVGLDPNVRAVMVLPTSIAAIGPNQPNISIANTAQTNTRTAQPGALSPSVIQNPITPVSVDTTVGPGIGPVSASSEVPSSSTAMEGPATGYPDGSNSTTTVAKPSQTPDTWPKTYVVKAGDTLELIAKRIYGPKEGLKRSNVMRIFEANRKVLDSPDMLRIGQQLTIPQPLAEGQSPSAQARSAVQQRPAATADRWYTVHEGDSLWKIAASQLGNSNRYTEILKLNADLLKDKDQLQVGMRLRLPAK